MEVYGVYDMEGRRALMKAIMMAREEDESDTDSLVCIFVIFFSLLFLYNFCV